MLKNRSSRRGVAVAMVAASALAGCYRTKIDTHVGGVPTGPEYSKRQWFTLGGLVPLSGETGQECQNGVATASSRESGTDVLVSLGMSVVGFLAAGAICSLPDSPTSEDVTSYSLCTSAVSGLPPFLVGSRTVEYRCRP